MLNLAMQLTAPPMSLLDGDRDTRTRQIPKAVARACRRLRKLCKFLDRLP